MQIEKDIEKAKTLVEVLPYVKEFGGYTAVIKYGGSALINEDIKSTIIQDIALLKCVGIKPVIVHGGGPDINNMLTRLNIESKFVNGLRVTDETTMEVVEMVLCGTINKAISSELTHQGINAVGISGKDAGLLKVEKKLVDGQDMGLVGEVKEVNVTLLRTLIDNDFVPVIAPIGTDDCGNTYNINADYAAVSIAGALNAEKLVFLTDVNGIMSDVNNKDSVYSRIKINDITKMIEDGTISGGMIPKVECCIAGVEAGVTHVHILDGRVQHCLLLEIFTKDGIGTLIER